MLEQKLSFRLSKKGGKTTQITFKINWTISKNSRQYKDKICGKKIVKLQENKILFAV